MGTDPSTEPDELPAEEVPEGDAPADTYGHTVADANAQEPNLDVTAPAASQVVPTGGPNDMVLAQTPEEVQAQIENRAGEDEDEAEA